MRRSSRFTKPKLLIIVFAVAGFLAPASSALTSDEALPFLVPRGTVLEVRDGGLVVAGNLVVDGDLVAAPGVPLTLHTGGDLIVRGRVLGSAGEPGEDGGDIRIVAQGYIVEEGGRIEAGPGGHGASAVVPEGLAVAGRGGRGGDLVVDARRVDVRGWQSAGRGGDGGHAYGATAIGGDGGSSGALVVNGEFVPVRGLTPQSEPQPRLGDLLPTMLLTHCVPVVDLSTEVALAGADGGEACAHGLQGGSGENGSRGDSDDCNVCGLRTYPKCGAYTPAEGDNKNGEKGQHGGSWGTDSLSHARPLPTLGGDAIAIAGRGGDTIGQGVPAGDGGRAEATGGTGGKGGDGGEGGDAGTSGRGCDGGNGGNGAPGGNAFATSGAQGVNPTDCPMNGDSGRAVAMGGPGGVMGIGGSGGSGGIGSPDGGRGADGNHGLGGHGSRTVPQMLPCLKPGAPTISTAYVGVKFGVVDECDRVRIKVIAPDFDGNSDITHYRVYRGDTSASMSQLGADRPYTGSPQIIIDQPVDEDATYYYSVTAISTIGEGPPSAVVSQTTTCLKPVIDPSIPGLIPTLGAPVLAAVVIPGNGPGKIELKVTWPYTAAVDEYKLYRREVDLSGLPVGNFVLRATFGYVDLITTYPDAGVPLVTYQYKVHAVVGGVEGVESNRVIVTAPPLRVVGVGGGTLHVTTSGAGGTEHTCTGVPVEVEFVHDKESFDFRMTLGAREDSSEGTWCRTGPTQESRYYTNGYDEVRGLDECDVLVTPFDFSWQDGRYSMTKTYACDGELVESHSAEFNVTSEGMRVENTVTTYVGGVTDRIVSFVSDLEPTDAVTPPSPPSPQGKPYWWWWKYL